jgi:hypothetical protein
MIGTYHDILDSTARLYIPDDLNLFPRVAARLNQKKTFIETLRARPALAILLAILALLLLTGVAYAIGRLTGYIPGVGLIDQSALLRVLAEPVSQTRDGITITVTSAVLTSDRTVVMFTLENVPWEALSHQENVAGCSGMAEVHLPDGTSLQFSEGGGGLGQNRFVYASIPAGVNNATLVLPCIGGTLPGKAPEDWELPLHFIPTPPSMTIVPVIEIAPTPTTESMPTESTENPLTLTKVLEVGDTYLLFGEFHSSQPQNGTWWNQTGNVQIIDGKGQAVLYTIPNDIELPPRTQPDSEAWVYKISKNFTPPLTISYPGIYIAAIGQPQEFDFEFDAGPNPQPGQEWTLNKEFTLDGYTIQLISISVDSRGGGGYNFSFDVPPSTDMFAEHANALSIESVNIAGYSPIGGGGGSGGFTQTYEKLPTGKLKIVIMIKHLASGSKKDWQIQWTPENPSVNTSLYGIALKIDKYIPLDDGYYLIGHTEWNDKRITMASPWDWNMHAYDGSGREIPLEPASDTGLLLQPDQWIYHIYGKKFDGPITLRADRMNVVFGTSIQITLDLRPYNFNFSDEQLGMPFKTGLIPMDIPAIQANAFKVTYVKQGDLHGLEIAIQADPVLQDLPLDIESGLDTSGLTSINGGGGSNRDDVNGLVLSTVLTNAKITFPLVLSARNAGINGTWETNWNPPAADPNATPFFAPQACITSEKWKQAVDNPMPLPVGLPGKVLISRGALSPDPSLFISTLDGSAEQALVFGDGSLSPDGTKLVYSNADGHLDIINVSTKQNLALTNGASDLQPFWSPDGTRIVFTRQTHKGENVFVMDADGQNVRALTDTTENPRAVGWMPDSKRVVAVITRDSSNVAQLLDLAGGLPQTIVATQQPGDATLSVSPDGQWIAFVDKVIGRRTSGIYVSRFDGSEKHLLAQLDDWMAMNPVWSPDGKWLAFSVMNTDQYQTHLTPALVNVETCQVVPLTGLNGTIEQWVNH